MQTEEANERLSIVPEATLFEPARPRKEDIKPGMSNVTVRSDRRYLVWYFLDQFSFSDILHHYAGNDRLHCADRARHHVLPETQGELAQTVVETQLGRVLDYE